MVVLRAKMVRLRALRTSAHRAPLSPRPDVSRSGPAALKVRRAVSSVKRASFNVRRAWSRADPAASSTHRARSSVHRAVARCGSAMRKSPSRSVKS